MLAVADAQRTEKAWAWFSNAGLRKKTNLGQRSVQDAVTDLLKLGEVQVEYQTGPGGCNRYRVLMQTPAESAPPPQNPHPAESAPPEDASESESPQVNGQTPAISAPPAESAGVRILPPTPAESAPGTLMNPTSLPTAETARSRARAAAGNASDVIAAYVDGAVAAGLQRPPEKLRGRVGRDAKQLLAEGYALDFLVGAAYRMGAGEWNDLAVQVRRDDASTNGHSGDPGKDRRQQATDAKFARALERARARDAQEGRS